jgi:hypothetical protein
MRVPPLGGTASARGSAGGSATLGMIDGTEPVFRLPQALTPLALDDDGHDDEEENEQAHHDQATHVQVALGDLLAPELHVGAPRSRRRRRTRRSGTMAMVMLATAGRPRRARTVATMSAIRTDPQNGSIVVPQLSVDVPY